MTIGSISASGLSQSVFASSNATALKQRLGSLQSSLATGDLSGAQLAFQALQTLLQYSASASGDTLSSTSQLSKDLVSLGGALSGGDLATAQSVFVSVQNDLKTSQTPSGVDELTAASDSVQLVSGVLSALNTGPPTSSDSTASLLGSVYGTGGTLNVYA